MSDSPGGIKSAESKRAKPKKTLDRLELRAKMGGGHVVRHVYTSYEHEPREVHFNEDGKGQGGEHIAAHLAKHAGVPVAVPEGEGESEYAEQEKA